VRGGAIPVLVWGTILAVLAAGNWVWDDKPVNSGAATAAVLIIYGTGLALWRRGRREAIRPGPPEPGSAVEPVPQGSLAAVLIGLSIGSILFGLAWAKFVVFFGFGLLVLSLGRLLLEVRAERASRRQAESR
jgi:membrane protein implicated in regulation of membrane protease activity